MTDSRQKGKRGELECSKELMRVFDCTARRSQQYCGNNADADLVTSISGLHCEVKRVEKMRLYPWLEQATQGASATDCPVVFHRQNNKQWVASLYLDDLPGLVALINEFMEDQDG